jgi:hypothetical protein
VCGLNGVRTPPQIGEPWHVGVNVPSENRHLSDPPNHGFAWSTTWRNQTCPRRHSLGFARSLCKDFFDLVFPFCDKTGVCETCLAQFLQPTAQHR